MRWPWSPPKPIEDEPAPENTAAEEIAELMVEHRQTLRRVSQALADHTARIMEHYDQANRERRE